MLQGFCTGCSFSCNAMIWLLVGLKSWLKCNLFRKTFPDALWQFGQGPRQTTMALQFAEMQILQSWHNHSVETQNPGISLRDQKSDSRITARVGVHFISRDSHGQKTKGLKSPILKSCLPTCSLISFLSGCM